MLLWRIASNALTTRQNISLRTHIPDPSCNLCGHASESTCHIFFHCPVAKAIWFSCWGPRTEDHNIQECADLVKLILNSPMAISPDCEQWRISSTMAFAVEEIWLSRNQHLFQGVQINIRSICSHVLHRALEFANICLNKDSPNPGTSKASWVPPPGGFIKVNVDAAVTSATTALAAVARDHHGNPIKVWMKKYRLCSPIQAGAVALLYAAQLASQEGWKHVILKGDSKVCIDSLSEPNVLHVWSIFNIRCKCTFSP